MTLGGRLKTGHRGSLALEASYAGANAIHPSGLAKPSVRSARIKDQHPRSGLPLLQLALKISERLRLLATLTDPSDRR